MRAMAFLVALSMALASTAVLADVPGLINYQGTLTDEYGAALDTTVDMTFSIYTDSTGGSQVWTETQTAVGVSNGVFNVLLGRVNVISDTVFNDPSRWLGVQVGGDAELQPRQRMAGVGYAFWAAASDTAEYARSTPSIADGDWTLSGNHIYSAVPGSVGIGTTTPAAKLDVRGTLNVGQNLAGYDVNLYGQYDGSRFFWDKSKMALRAGWDTDGSHWAPDSIGPYSLAAGTDSKASGYASTAMGYVTTAGGDHSTATGYYTTASGGYSTAMGSGTIASGYNSTAMGLETEASGNWGATAMGYATIASGDRSTAMGRETEASGLYSTSMGIQTTASGDRSTAMGEHTTASGYNSTAMGGYTTASGDYGSLAIGRWVKAGPADYTMVLGRGTTSGDTLVNNIGNSLMVGFNTTTPTLFVGGVDHRLGIRTTSPAAALDVQGTVNVGQDSSGYDVNFYGGGGSYDGARFFWDEDKMALRAGRDTDGSWAPDSVGRYSLATGYNTKASGEASTAMGYFTTAKATNGATAMGSHTIASGVTSTAMGSFTTASGLASTAMGTYTTASGYYSTAIGRWVTADTTCAIVLGKGYTESDHLVNSIPNSLMVGFNNTTPTLFVDYFSVGINTTSPAYTFYVNGSSGGTGVWYNDSDERLKKNIAKIEDALNKISQLEGVYFEWKDVKNRPEGMQMGMIAQQVKEVVPEVVQKKGEYYSMATASLVPLLIEATKELRAENRELREEIEKIKAEIR